MKHFFEPVYIPDLIQYLRLLINVFSLTKKTQIIFQQASTRLTKQSLTKLKTFSHPKNKPNTPICYRGLLLPEVREERKRAVRMPKIEYTGLDGIGHGFQVNIILNTSVLIILLSGF